ncbi:MAG: aryldialkylphosphatase [Rhodospirillales bacterium]|nr:aryldialkylphosphatase [Rhodospirillales bacterium]
MSTSSGKVQTVLGPIDPADLGPTLMHEHLATEFTPPAQRGEIPAEITLETIWELNYNWVDAPGVRCLTDTEVAVREVERMIEAGGKSVVDVSTRGMGVDPTVLRKISERTGAQIVLGCGRYLEEFMGPEDLERTVDDMAAEFIGHVNDGIDDTGVRAGIIGEIGCSWPWTKAERRSMQAAVVAQQETGLALTIHPGRHEDAPFEIVSFLRDAGADLSRTIMDHVERRLFDTDSILRLAETGIVLEFDMFGFETSRFAQGGDIDLSSDGVRLTRIRDLLDAGYRDRIVISHDICTRTRQMEFGGHGCGHIFRNIVPMMRRRDFDEPDIQAVLIDNPANLLTGKKSKAD